VRLKTPAVCDGLQREANMRVGVFWPVLVAATLAITSPAIAGSGNPSHDWLMKMSASSRALVLGLAIGNDCAGKSAFFVGMDKDNNSVWGVRCEDGDSYVVRVAPGPVRSAFVARQRL
jgi:hypothetical protein